MPTYEELIETLVKTTTLPFSKVGTISALARLGDTRAIPHLIEALNDENHYVRREATRVIGQFGSPEAMEAILGLLEGESDEETRRNALIALGNIGDERAFETLRQALKNSSYLIRRAAEMGLEQLQKRLRIQQPVAKNLLETSTTEESMNFEEIASSPRSPISLEEIPSYRELTNSVSQGNTVGTLNTDEVTSPTSDTWQCNRCGDEAESYYDICQTCGGRRGEPGIEKISAEDADLEYSFEAEFDLNCPRCGEKMLEGYLFTESDDALIFNYQEENDIVIGRGTQMGFVCLKCNLISFPFRKDRIQD
ncbi:MAG: HEAT repeat domain-containing protein [Candidatus Poribacteria bacterium]